MKINSILLFELGRVFLIDDKLSILPNQVLLDKYKNKYKFDTVN